MPVTSHVERHFTANRDRAGCRDWHGGRLHSTFRFSCRSGGCIFLDNGDCDRDLAEIVAGTIAMGLGGYLAARTDRPLRIGTGPGKFGN